MFGTEPLVAVTRGGRLESEHRGVIAVVDATGQLIAHVGDVELVSYLRSSAKPFQLLPLIDSGAADRLGFTDRELAVIAASHSGEPQHVAAVQSILNKIGLPEAALQCGVHPPFNAAAAKALSEAGQVPSAIHNNCSGKHAGMLAQAIDRGLTTHDYLEQDHPIQITIRQALADLSSVAFDEVGIGVDGCSVPCFALPLKSAALAFAKLADAQTPALARIRHVMTEYPEMIGGEGRLDSDLMRAAKGRVISKGGAEGYHGFGVLPSADRPALGIAIKIADGDGRRGGHPVVIEVLKQLGVLNEEALLALKSYHTWTLTNHRGIDVGEVRPGFSLAFVTS